MLILRRIEGKPVVGFTPKDKGSMATIGRQAAVVRLGNQALDRIFGLGAVAGGPSFISDRVPQPAGRGH